jgi:hypothetical protein
MGAGAAGQTGMRRVPLIVGIGNRGGLVAVLHL